MIVGSVFRVNPHISMGSHLSPRTKGEVFPVTCYKADGSVVKLTVKDLKKDGTLKKAVAKRLQKTKEAV